jgi:hypothetical protein
VKFAGNFKIFNLAELDFTAKKFPEREIINTAGAVTPN